MNAAPLASFIATRVYFIQCGAGGPIKVGIAENPEARLADLQAANPEQLELLGTMVGTLSDEQTLHRLFASGRIRGEWFRADTPGLAEIVEAAQVDVFQGQDLCERCLLTPVSPGRRKYCEECAPK